MTEIIVCIKLVPDPANQLKLDSATNMIDKSNCNFIPNPNDQFAVEAGLTIRDFVNEGRVTVISLGPAKARKALISVLTMGADRAIHLCDDLFEGINVHTTSVILAKAIKLLNYDFILCGDKSWDDAQGYVGAGIANILRIPIITGVTEVKPALEGKNAIALRRLWREDQLKVECSLPAVFCVAMKANKPRCGTLYDGLRALKQEIPIWDRNTLEINLDEFNTWESLIRLETMSYPRPRSKKVLLPDASMSITQRLKFFLSAGVSEKKSNLLDGSKEETISEVTDFLLEHGIIQRGSLK